MAKMEKIKENKAALKMLEEAIPRMVEYLTEFDIEKDEPYSYEITFDGRGIGVRLGTIDFDKPFAFWIGGALCLPDKRVKGVTCQKNIIR